MKKNIALIGFMGTGKTTVGKILAEKLNYKFIETDDIIEQKAGKSITDIFKQDGEKIFREQETEIIKELSDVENAVISCGGGVVLNKQNIDSLKKNSIIIRLTTSPAVLLSRMKDDTNRPLLNTEDKQGKIKDLINKREPFYRASAEITIDTTDLTCIETCNEILETTKKYIQENAKAEDIKEEKDKEK